MRRLLEYDFNPSRLDTLQSIGIAFSTVSFVGGFFVVVSFLKFDRLRSHFAFEQVTNMCIADMGASVTYFIGSPGHRTALCISQAFFQQLFEVASVLWASVIATSLFVAVRRRENFILKRWQCYLYAYGLAFVFALLPFSTSSYGASGAWCWIKPKPRAESNAWRFSIFYLPIWISIIYNARCYAECAFVLHRMSTIIDDAASYKLKRTVLRLIRYPLILTMCWTIPTVNRLQQIFEKNPNFYLYIFTVISRASIGGLNALAFGFTDQVKAEWRQFFRIHFRRRPERQGGQIGMLQVYSSSQYDQQATDGLHHHALSQHSPQKPDPASLPGANTTTNNNNLAFDSRVADSQVANVQENQRFDRFENENGDDPEFESIHL